MRVWGLDLATDKPLIGKVGRSPWTTHQIGLLGDTKIKFYLFKFPLFHDSSVTCS